VSSIAADERAPPPSRPKYFRIADIPPAWSKDDLLNAIRRADPLLLGHEQCTVSLFPATYSCTYQIAILNMNHCPKSLEQLEGDERYIETYDKFSRQKVGLFDGQPFSSSHSSKYARRRGRR